MYNNYEYSTIIHINFSSFMIHPQILKIADKLCEAVQLGLFNDIWYYIKDFQNYKIQIQLEAFNEDESSYMIIIGEIDSNGYKDVHANYYPINSDIQNKVPTITNNNKSKYDIEYVRGICEDVRGVSEINNTSAHGVKKNIERLNHISHVGTPFDLELKLNDTLFEKNKFSINLPIDLLPKIEESVLRMLFFNDKLRKILFELTNMLYYADNDLDEDFDGSLSFVSIITERQNNSLINIFMSFDYEEFNCKIIPEDNSILTEIYKILDYHAVISNQLPSLPKTILDDLTDLEMKEQKPYYDKVIVFKEYHRLVERFANYIYDKLYDEIQKSSSIITDEDTRKYLSITEMVRKKESYKIMSLKKFSDLLKYLTHRDINILDSEMKNELKEKYIPIIDTYSGFSQLQNIYTHDKLTIDPSVIKTGIVALKHIIRDGYKLFVAINK